MLHQRLRGGTTAVRLPGTTSSGGPCMCCHACGLWAWSGHHQALSGMEPKPAHDACMTDAQLGACEHQHMQEQGWCTLLIAGSRM